jgi:hypothetical protein
MALLLCAELRVEQFTQGASKGEFSILAIMGV